MDFEWIDDNGDIHNVTVEWSETTYPGNRYATITEWWVSSVDGDEDPDMIAKADAYLRRDDFVDVKLAEWVNE